MKMKRILSAFLTLVMLLTSLVVSTEAAWADKVDEKGNPIIDYIYQEYLTPEQKLADMVFCKEVEGFEIYFEEFTGEVAFVDTLTGQVHFTNPFDIALEDQKISETVKEKLLSQIHITFLENGAEKSMNSYVEAALRGQIKLKNIKNGIRVEYILGEEQTTRLVPRMINKERFEELILGQITDEWTLSKLKSFYTLQDKDDPDLSERAIAQMQISFPITQEMAIYVCADEISTHELRTCEEIIKTYCPLYTYEMLDEDHDITGYTGDDAAPPRFRMSLEYTVNKYGVEVRLPANGIEFDESAYQFQTISILPYFDAGSNRFEGYTVIPDGSGALIRFEDFINKSVNLFGKIYGEDYAYHEINGQHSEVMRMPYYGVVANTYYTEEESNIPIYDSYGNLVEKKKDYEGTGFLAIITEGDSLASLMAECGGLLHPYNTVYPTFIPRPSDEYNLTNSISVSGNATWTVTSKRKYTDSYRIQYIFLRDEEIATAKGLDNYYEAEWQGMAKAYRDYYTDAGVLSKLENTKEDIPLFIETFGAIQTMDRVLSFPVTVDTPLTTFEDIKTMHSELTELGVGNVNFKLTGYANGGMQATAPYKLNWLDAVGGKDGFADLSVYAEEKGFDVYPDFDFAYVAAEDAFDGYSAKEHAVRTIDDRYTTRRAYDPATQSFDKSFAVAVSPAYYDYFYEGFNSRYEEYGNDSIAVSSLGTDLNSDFDEDEPYHREDNKNFTKALLEKISSDYENVMVEGGNAYTVPYADVILNASLTSSEYVKASETIPFLGMVYHGSRVFTGSATNMEGDINEAILQAIENGAAMYFTLSYRNTSQLKEDVNLSKYYSVAYDIWKDDVAKYYTVLNEALKDLQTAYIVDHEFMRAARIPDADELEADRLAREEAEAKKAAADAEKALAKEKEKELKDRLKEQGMTYEEPATGVNISSSAVGSSSSTSSSSSGSSSSSSSASGATEETVVPDKYATVSGSVVRVEYEGNVNFILNYNSFDVTVEYEGETYTVSALNFVRID